MKGLWKINDIDLYEVYGVAILKGSYNDIMSPPTPRKRLEYTYTDRDGTAVDTTTPLTFDAKRYKLKCAMYASSENDFWTKYWSFISFLQQPGSFNLWIAELGNTFTILYEGIKVTAKPTRLRESNRIAVEFEISIFEPIAQTTPALNPDMVIVADGVVTVVDNPSEVFQIIDNNLYLNI